MMMVVVKHSGGFSVFPELVLLENLRRNYNIILLSKIGKFTSFNWLSLRKNTYAKVLGYINSCCISWFL